jgi:hypothetical protein
MDINKAPSRISAMLSLVPEFVRERRLPWRLSQTIARVNLQLLRRYYDRQVLFTRPFLTGEDCPHFEVHTLLGHNHVGMVLWSVKSFLHQAGKKYTVVLHDDGSLTDSDTKTLGKHLLNVKIIRKSTADTLIEERITGLPNCCEYRFTAKETSDHRGIKYDMHIFAVRLFDFNLISNGTKTLVLDADVLFFKMPREIIEWAEDVEDRNSLYSVEQYIPRRNSQNEIIGYELKTPRPTDANAGLLCFDKRAFSLEALEDWIGANKEKMNTYATFEQAAYNHLIKSKGGSTPLPDTYSFNYTDQNVIATHFAIKILFFTNLKRLEKALH